MTRPPKREKLHNSLSHPPEQLCFEGESLDHLLKAIDREIECVRSVDRALPDKVWFKQLFSIGVNEVTRLLERMPPIHVNDCCSLVTHSDLVKVPPVQLQAILLAADCNPQWLTKHLSSLAASRRVPLFFVKDKKRASLRLGEVVKLKIAIAVGVKARGNTINHFISSHLLQRSE
ncbi:PREDICTED: uncharacterized protein LOC109159570 [Ipomoea nil]|uniref:uncharacterized protein LOC109159570 n=1 Tax=Ipomoea nil TaxID=35883 RepID=UPI000901467B|nr:PREDICTED: uncharacterized protein LOC109159570 [Ipomoea nil]XP_019163222.1 PREDICTED: uncharacterized protein LOC109159570 [Ipomoea nil]